MWSSRSRGGASEPAASPPVNLEFADALAGALAREARWRPLIEAVQAAIALAEAPGPLDAAAAEANGPLDAAAMRELAAQIKLSSYLRRDLRVLVDRFGREAATLAAASRAGDRLAAEPGLVIDPEAVTRLYGLFWGLDQAAGLFPDYPAVERLFREAAAGPEAAPAPDDAAADEAGWFTDQAPEPPAPAKARGWGWPAWLRRWFDPAPPHASPDGLPDSAELFREVEVAPLTLELGSDLITLIDRTFGGDLLERFQGRRRRIAERSGFVVPGVQVKDNYALRPNAYRLLVRLDVVAQGTLLTGYQLALRPDDRPVEADAEAALGFPATDPASGRPGVWVAGAEAARAAEGGYAVRDAADVILDHVEATIVRHAHEILSLDEVGFMLNLLRESRPEVANTVPYKLDLAELHQVLRLLLRERVTIRDLESVLEALNHHLTPTREPPNLMYSVWVDTSQQFIGSQIDRVRGHLKVSPEDLAEVVRRRLARQICQGLADAEGVIEVVELKPQVEDMVLGSLKREGAATVLALRADSEDRLLRSLGQACAGLDRPVLLCDPAIRPYVRRLAERAFPDVAVLSRAEIHPAYRTQAVGVVSLGED